MAEIKHFIDRDSIQKDADIVTGHLNQVVSLLEKIKNTRIELKGSSSFGQATKLAKDLTDQQSKLAEVNLKLAKAERELATAKLQTNKADTESVKTKKQQVDLDAKLAKEKERLIKLAEKEGKEIEKANNEYIKLNNSYKAASAASTKRGAELLKEANGNELLFQSLLRTDKEYLATTKSAKQYNDQLLLLEQNVGRSQRNVGNYASAFSGLNNSFAQVARELPSLTISFQQFALAISNNLPIAADEIARAKVEIARLKAEGQAAPSLFQTITKSILSFQVGLSILITGFVALAPKIADFVSGMFDGADATDKATAKINAFAGAALRSEGELSSLNAELDRYITLLGEQNKTLAGGDLDLLRAQLQISYQKETQAIKTRNEAWQSYLDIGKEITKLSTGEDLFGNTVDKTVPDEIKKQQDDVLKIYQDAGKQVQDELFNQQLLTVRISNQKIEDEKEKNEKIKQSAEELSRLRKKVGEDELAAQRALILFRLQQEADAQERILNSDKFTYEERLIAAENFIKASEVLIREEEKQELETIERKRIEAKLSEKDVQEQKALVREKFAAKSVEIEKSISEKILAITKESLSSEEKLRNEAFEKKLKNIEKQSAIEIANLQKQRDEELLLFQQKANAEELAADPETRKTQLEKRESERLAIIRKYIKLELEAQLQKARDLISIETDPVKRAELEAQIAAIKLKIDSEVTDEKIKNLKSIAEEEKRLAELQKQLQREILGLVKSFTLGRFDVAKNQIQDQIDKTEEQKRKEIDAINETTLSAQEKAARITNAEKKAQVERERLELRQRQLDRQRAQFERAFNLAQIAINTIKEVGKIKLAIAGHIATLNPVGAGIAASQIPIAIATGAIQAAAVLATPIPKFKTGKGQYDQYEGPAWVGDGGKSEMIFREDGSIERTPSKPTLTFIGKDDIIHPDANALLMHSISKQTNPGGAKAGDSFAIVADQLSKKLDHVGNQISGTIKNKREWIVNVNNGKPSIMSKDGNRYKKYLNDNLQFGK